MNRIEFETAKLAKEAGYRNNSSVSYWFGEKGNVDVKGRTNETPWYRFPDDEEKYLSFPRYFAPYQAELQEWLRNVHRHHIDVHLIAQHEDFSKEEWTLEITDVPFTTVYTNDLFIFKSYEEALEKGLQEALKLIKL